MVNKYDFSAVTYIMLSDRNYISEFQCSNIYAE